MNNYILDVMNKLKKEKNSNITQYSLNGMTLPGIIVDIYDGDTCKVVLLNTNNLQTFNCRLSGLNATKMKPTLKKVNRYKEIIHAKQCRNRLIQLVTNCECGDLNSSITKKNVKKLLEMNSKIITIKCGEFDKYGHLLVRLYNDETCEEEANQILINESFAKAYDGVNKSVFTYE